MRFPTQYNLYVDGRNVVTGLSRQETNNVACEVLTFFLFFVFGLAFGLIALLIYW